MKITIAGHGQTLKLHRCAIAAVLVSVYLGIVLMLATDGRKGTMPANMTLTNSTQGMHNLANSSHLTLTQDEKQASPRHRRNIDNGQAFMGGRMVYQGQQHISDLTKDKAQTAVLALEAYMVPTNDTLFVMYIIKITTVQQYRWVRVSTEFVSPMVTRRAM